MDRSIDDVLARLVALKGVKHASIYSAEWGFASTLPVERQGGIEVAADMVEQIVAALRVIDKGHNEIYIEFDEGLITVYETAPGTYVLLVTEKKINFPMVSMGVKSVAAKIGELVRSGGRDDRFSPRRGNASDRIRIV